MPELPDIAVYMETLESRIAGATLQRAEIAGPFLLRTAELAPQSAHGHKVTAVRRIGKRIAIGFEGELWFVMHLMIAGRLHWNAKYKKPDGRRTLASFVFDTGCLTLTEAGSRKRASLHVVQGLEALLQMDPGGIDVFSATPQEFRDTLTRENHTLKRSLTDPHLFSGIGNAYSDEILHRAGLSPILLTSRITQEQVETLRRATHKFPEGVTAFRSEMAVHGKYGKACPRCGAKVQRIRYAENETNYCARCQTGGKLLADRSLSRLLREDWPRTIEEWEQRRHSPRPIAPPSSRRAP